MKFKNISILIFILVTTSDLSARESFQFNLGDKIHILSDKAFRRSQNNVFEAVGNVVITHKNNSIYGEKASMTFSSGDTKVVGNVRYIGPQVTLYGSELKYNLNSAKVLVKNARIISDNYIVLGKEISRESNNVLIAKDAEYTTCQDCPESWSIFGKKVHITLGEYIRIQHAFVKVKGVVVMYIPYLILPIKKKRETGLLFPSFGFNFDEGARYRQPWFWALSDSNDLTLTPSILGRRGWGNELQFRQVLKEKVWFEVNSLQSWDKIYEPFKRNTDDSGQTTFRHISEYEHHFATGNNFSHHLNFTDLNDLDAIRDFDYFASDKVTGPETGGGGFFGYRTSLFDINLESYFNKNQLVKNPKEFDHSYVQILPEVNLSMQPISILHTDVPFFRDISFGLDSDFTVFKQNHFAEGNFIRNAQRHNAVPYLDWKLGYLGPVFFKTSAKFDYQHYRFPYAKQKTFTKSGYIYETEASVKIEKIYGLSYRDEIPADKLSEKSRSKNDSNVSSQIGGKSIIGVLPKFSNYFNKEVVNFNRVSYRHSQEYKLKHYFFSDSDIHGNEKFKNQISQNDGSGQFDYIDSIRDREFELNQTSLRTTLPVRDTVEVQWNNSVVRKTTRPGNSLEDGRTLRQNFRYDEVSFFNISQGYDLRSNNDKVSERFTRLFMEGSLSYEKLSFNASEFYFYSTQKHVFTIGAKRKFERGEFGFNLIYDSLSTPINKLVDVEGSLDITSLLTLYASYDYDIEDKKYTNNTYGMIYSPANNCWKFDLRYSRDLINTKIAFNFLINFNENNFRSLSGRK